MNIAQLQQLLDVHGTEPSAWPAALRRAAEDLINSDAAASRAYQHARRLEGLILRHLASGLDVPAQDASAKRVMQALTAPLPRQKQAWHWWPAELATVDFAPAWPRVAALASVAIVGFALGLAGLEPGIAGRVARGTPPDADLSAIVFDPEPATGLRP